MAKKKCGHPYINSLSICGTDGEPAEIKLTCVDCGRSREIGQSDSQSIFDSWEQVDKLSRKLQAAQSSHCKLLTRMIK